MGNVIMKAQQIAYGASNVEKALDDLKAPELIELNKRMDAIDAWKANVHEETYTGSELTIENALALPARSLITSIGAIQDLHGYDKPWVGGADINLLDLKSRFPDNAKSVTSDGVTYTRVDDADGNPIGVQASNTATGYSYCDVQLTLEAGRYKSAVTGIEANKMSLNFRKGTNREYFKAANEEFTLTEQTLIFVRYTVNQGDTANNTIKCMIYKYDGTDKTFRPYSNICPISGRTAVVVDDVGKNQWDASADDTVYGWGGTWSKSGQTYTCVASSSSIQLFSENGTAAQASHSVSVEPNSNYCVSVSGMNISQVFGVMYDKNKQFLRFVRQQTIVNNSAVIAVPSDAYYMGLRIDNNSATSGTTYNFKIQIEKGSTATPYEPYAHSSATIQLGQTVYGGSLNVTTGVMTVNAKIEDMGNLTYNYNSANNVFGTALISDMADVDTSRVQVISSVLKGLPAKDLAGIVAADDNSIAFNSVNASKFMRIKCTTYTDGTAIKTAFTGQKICYELATPTTLQLTPEQLQMLKGYNRVTIESGSIELKALVLGGDN